MTASMDADRLRSFLPWRQPFEMIDRLVECVPHERIVTAKALTGNDSIGSMGWAGRNEGANGGADGRTGGVAGPVFPSALVLEGMSQSAALLFQLSYGALSSASVPVLGDMTSVHHGFARAGDRIVFAVRAVKMTSTAALFEAEARVDDRTIAEARFAMAIIGPAERSEQNEAHE